MEHGGGHASIADLLWPAVNFILFALLAARAAGPKVRSFFATRTATLRAALAAGAEARARAAALQAEIERDLGGLDAVRERLKGDMRATAEYECAQLVESGRATAERIRADARMVAEQELIQARDALRAEVAQEAVRQATAMVRDALRPEDQQRFLAEFATTAGATS